MNRVILHIDMNSYFASVEQQANPFLRGKPVGVCAYLSPNGCIIASSTEAKKLGIKTGCRVRDAVKLYPKIALVENEPAKYRSVTKKIFSIFSDYTDRVEPYSIDEAFLDLTGWVRRFGLQASGGRAFARSDHENAYVIASSIKSRIQKEVGDWLKCSAGIAPTRYLAKLGSDVAEKNSIFTITEENLEEVLGNIKLTEAWGIKQRMEWRLNRLGIYTLLDLKHYPVANIMQSLGKMGYYLWANMNAIEIEEVKSESDVRPKSFGHQYALAKKTTDPKFLNDVLLKLSEKTGRRLRSHSLQAKNLSAYLGYVSGGGIFHNKKAPHPLFTTNSIYRAAKHLLFSHPLADRARIIAVSVSGLIPLSNQLSFFENTIQQKNASLAMDAINDAYGEFTIISGDMFGMQKFVQDRIGFRKIELE